MKSTIVALYFAAMLFIVASLVADIGYTYSDALFISSTYLPTVVLAHALTSGFKFQGVANIIGALLATLGLFILQLLLITLANYALERLSYEVTMPDIVINPILILLIFMLYYLPYRLIIDRLFRGDEDREKRHKIEFVSNRKRIRLLAMDILYIESCNTEVWLHTNGGESYRSRTNISSWQRELGSNFLRIHRSYLINREYLDSANREEITLKGGAKLPISRSYQQSVAESLR